MTSDTQPLYIKPTSMPARDTLRAVRSQVTHTLLAWWSDEEGGLYLLDRRSNTQHFLSFSDTHLLDNNLTKSV